MSQKPVHSRALCSPIFIGPALDYANRPSIARLIDTRSVEPRIIWTRALVEDEKGSTIVSEDTSCPTEKLWIESGQWSTFLSRTIEKPFDFRLFRSIDRYDAGAWSRWILPSCTSWLPYRASEALSNPACAKGSVCKEGSIKKNRCNRVGQKLSKKLLKFLILQGKRMRIEMSSEWSCVEYTKWLYLISNLIEKIWLLFELLTILFI